MNVICLEDKAFETLVLKVVALIKSEQGIKEDKWLSTEEAMGLLRIKSKTTLQKYRDEGSIRYSEISPRYFLYDRESLLEFLDKKSHDTF
jgi:hypothetical protein